MPASEVESNKNRLACLINTARSVLQRQPRVQLTFLFSVRGRGSSGEGVAGTKKTILPNRETRQRLAAARRHRLRGPNDTARWFNRTKQPLFLRFYAACLFTKHFTWHHGLGCCWVSTSIILGES